MNYSIVLFAIIICAAKQIYSENPTITSFKELHNILNNGYERELRPDAGENKTTDIGITAYIMYLEFNEKEKTITSDMYFRQQWVDSRLARETPEYVVGSKPLRDSIWTPDTFFPNSLDVRTIKFPTPNLFVKIEANGTVFHSQRLQHSSRCNKKDEFSFECRIEFESYGYSAKDIRFYLKKGPSSLQVADNLPVNEAYKLTNYTMEETSETLSMGVYSRMIMKLLIENQQNVKKTAVKETKEMVSTNDMITEGKKIGTFFKNIKFDLPSFPKAQPEN